MLSDDWNELPCTDPIRTLQSIRGWRQFLNHYFEDKKHNEVLVK